MKKIIVVLGMHRSGTSAVTRGLKVLGAEFGSNLMPAKEGDNAKGFWEDIGICQLNEKILKKIDSRWDAWSDRKLNASLLASLNEEKQFAIKLLSERTEEYNIFAFKDPRVSVLLPFWIAVFEALTDVEINFLLVIRNPKSVAASLQKRNAFPFQKSYALWLRYNYRILKDIGESTFTVIDYDNVMSAPEQELMRLASRFNISRDSISEQALAEYSGDFLTEDLRHTQYKEKDIFSSESMPLIREYYAYLYKLAVSKNENTEKEIERLLLKIETHFSEYSQDYNYFDDIENKATQGNQDVNTLTAELMDTRQHVSSLEEELKQCQKDYQERDLELTESRQQVSSLVKELKKLDVELERTDSALATNLEQRQDELTNAYEHTALLEKELKKCQHDYQERDFELTESREHALSLVNELKQCQQDYQDREIELAQAREHASSLEAELRKCQQDYQDREIELAQAREHASSLEAELRKCQQDYQDRGVELTKTREHESSLTEELKKSLHDYKEREIELERVSEHASALELELKKCQQDYDDRNRALATAQQHIDLLTKELENYQ